MLSLFRVVTSHSINWNFYSVGTLNKSFFEYLNNIFEHKETLPKKRKVKTVNVPLMKLFSNRFLQDI